VPVTIADGKKVYGIAVRTKTEDIYGNDVASEDRSRTDGWEIPAFWGSPIALGNKLYFTTMLGITYVVDSNARVLDEKALLAVNDLGPSGETWSLNTPSFSDGVLYHRSLKEVVAIRSK
jgi:hypothetical protein